MTTVQQAKDGQCYFISLRIATDFAALFALFLLFLLVSSAKAATFTPYFYDVLVTNRVDLDGDGYAIESSQDLFGWAHLAVLTNSIGMIRFIDSSPAQRRYYRAVLQP